MSCFLPNLVRGFSGQSPTVFVLKPPETELAPKVVVEAEHRFPEDFFGVVGEEAKVAFYLFFISTHATFSMLSASH